MPRWIVWRLETRQGKPTKVPHTSNGSGLASVTDPATWVTFDEAVRCFTLGGYNGIGYVFTAEEGIVGIDLDDCCDAVSETIQPWARRISEELETYTEYSQSGKGLHLLCRAKLLGPKRRKKKDGMALEMYDRERYFAMTGCVVPGASSKIEERTDKVCALYAEWFGAAVDQPSTRQQASSPLPMVTTGEGGMEQALSRQQPVCDQEVLARAHLARNADKFRALWEGRFADISDPYESQSNADLALCRMLAFHSQGNAEQIDRIFRQSKLYRPKWDERRGDQTYGERTVHTAIEGERAVANQDWNQDTCPVITTANPGSPLADVVLAAGSSPPTDGRAWFNVHTASSLRVRVQELGKTEYIVEGLIPQQSLVAAIGDSGKGKTPLFYQLGLCVATGKPFLGRPTKQGLVLYLDFENGLTQVDTMIERLTQHIGATWPVDDFLHWNLNDAPESWGEAGCTVLDLIRHVQPSLVMIDPLSAPYPEVDEKNGDVNRLVKKFRLLMKEIGCSLVLVHHLKKPSDAEGAAKYSLEYGDVQQWFLQARGPRSLITATDVRLGIDTPHSSDSEVALVMGGYTRLQGVLPTLQIKRVKDDAGDAMGYDLLTGANLLLQPLRDKYAKLPDQFRHKDAKQLLGSLGGALSRDLDKLVAAGLIQKTAAGYEKVEG